MPKDLCHNAECVLEDGHDGHHVNVDGLQFVEA